MLVKGIALTFDSVIASRYCAVSRDRALIVAVPNDTLYDGEDESPYGHEWPASRLTLTDMARLRIISNQIRKPVNQLLKEAVEFYTTGKIPSSAWILGGNGATQLACPSKSKQRSKKIRLKKIKAEATSVPVEQTLFH